MKNISSALRAVLIVVVSLCVINSCKKDNDNNNAVTGSTIVTTVAGMVLDDSNVPLSGVTVTAYGQTTTTSQYGTFVLKDLNASKSRCILQFTKSGFFNRAHAFKAAANTVNYVRIVLNSNAVTQSFSASAGGTVTNNNASVSFMPNSFVTDAGSAYTGTVSVTVKHLSPGDANFGFSIPGGDLAGKNKADESVVLYSYGMMGVLLTGSAGEHLQLASGTTATLTMAVADGQVGSAPATIPLWHFDEATSLWMEQGIATLTGGNYVGTVTHFSWWNLDHPFEKATLKGKVVDCNGTPMPNVVVTVNAIFSLTTDQYGEFQNLVPAGLALTLQVLATNNPGLQNSQVENVPFLTNGQVYIVPSLVVPCPTRIAGTLQTCAGVVTTGFIIISNSIGFYNCQYTTTGAFSLAVPANSPLQLYAYAGTESQFQTVTSLTPPNTLNVGAVLLCDTGAVYNGNHFTLNGGPFSNAVHDIISSSAVGYYSGSSLPLKIYIQGVSASGLIINSYGISLMDTIPGEYSFYPVSSEVYISAADSNAIYAIYNDTQSASYGTTLTEFGSVGGRIKGHFSGPALFAIDGASYSGTFSGNFDVLRTQ